MSIDYTKLPLTALSMGFTNTNRAIPTSEVMTRQRIRAQERKEAKTWRVTPAAAHRKSFKARQREKAAKAAAAMAEAAPNA